MKRLFLFVILMSLPMMLIAQDESPFADTEPARIELTASDELVLVADYWTQFADDAPEEGVPVIMLLHMLGGNRSAWEPMILPLLDAGYNVLNVDMRGHGETRGSNDWDLAEADKQLWIDWINAQNGVRPESIAIVGGSIGSNMALIACANDPSCVTAVALSPGLDYRGVQPLTAVTEGLSDRSALLVGSYNDGTVVSDMLAMATEASGDIGLRMYRGRLHGTNMFRAEEYDIVSVVISWLDEHLG